MAHKKKYHDIEDKKEEVEKKDIKKSSKKTRKKRFDIDIWKITAVALAVLIIASLSFIFIKKSTSPTGDVCLFDTVKLDFYVMSQCPYGTQVEDAIKPVLDKLGCCVDFNLNYISTENPDGTFRSLHGEPETRGNIVQLCAAKYNPDKYMDMIVCQNKNARAIPDNWESCAKENDLNVEKIRVCYEEEEGKELLSENIKLAKAVEATGSPTIYMNDERYSSGRDTLSFTRAVCNKLQGYPECSSIPECASDADCKETGKIGKCENPNTMDAKCVFTDPAKVEVIVLVDERCKDCQTDRTMQTNKNYFPGIEERYVDYSTEEGKQLYEDYNIKYLPAYIFDEKITETTTWKTNLRLTTFFDEVSSKYILKAEAVDSTFDPTVEICDNNIDDDGDGKIDCKDSDCSEKMMCREEISKKLDLFVMSMCPFGTKALDSMEEVLENFEGEIDFNVYFIASENPDGSFRSLHGQPEVDENIRELCAIKYYPEDYKYMDYIWCRDKDIKADWKICVEEAGMDITLIENCFIGDEGKELHSENIKLGNELGIGASPTWLTNNKYRFSGIDAETIKKNYCEYNEGLEGCKNTLSSGSGASGSC